MLAVPNTPVWLSESYVLSVVVSADPVGFSREGGSEGGRGVKG